MLSPSTPSRSASRTASTTTRFLLSPVSDATCRCSLTLTGLLAPSNGLTSVQRTSIVRCTTYGVRVALFAARRKEGVQVEIRQRLDAGTCPAPPTSPAGAATMRVVGATAIALAASMVIQNAIFVATGVPGYGDPIEEVLAWHAQNRVVVAIAVAQEALHLPLLLGFLTGLHGIVGRRGSAGADWSRLAVAAGATFSAVFALYSVLWDGVVLSAGELTEPSP